MKRDAAVVGLGLMMTVFSMPGWAKQESETAPAETQEAVPETAPETTPPTVPETSPETTPDEIERIPSVSGTKKGIVYATGAGCEPRPEGQASGYSLLLEITGEEGEVCGTKIEITNVKQRRIFSHTLPSAWIYLDLPPGGYTIEVKRPKGPWHKLSTQTTAGRLQKGRVFLTP